MLRVVRRVWLIGLVLTASVGGWLGRGQVADWASALKLEDEAILVIGQRQLVPDAERYAALKDEVGRRRAVYAERYAAADSAAARDAVIAEASGFLRRVLPLLMDCWLGTPWDFHGTAEGPGDEAVACGYFVATVLRDAGFRVNRYRLAQQPSQEILRTFVPRSAWSLRVGTPYPEYAAQLRKLEPGVRIVGLDTHVGFLITGENSFRFVHSSGSEPWCVVDEGEPDARVLAASNYRVRGDLTSSREAVRKWLAGEKFAVAGR